MKCIKNMETGKITRVKDDVADKATDKKIFVYRDGPGYVYVPKHMYKEQLNKDV